MITFNDIINHIIKNSIYSVTTCNKLRNHLLSVGYTEASFDHEDTREMLDAFEDFNYFYHIELHEIYDYFLEFES